MGWMEEGFGPVEFLGVLDSNTAVIRGNAGPVILAKAGTARLGLGGVKAACPAMSLWRVMSTNEEPRWCVAFPGLSGGVGIGRSWVDCEAYGLFGVYEEAGRDAGAPDRAILLASIFILRILSSCPSSSFSSGLQDWQDGGGIRMIP